MTALDHFTLAAFVGLLLYDGLRQARRNRTTADHLLAGRRIPWWALGLSILATQASAITLVGAVGQGFVAGTGFVQFYYGMPLALALVAWWILPRIAQPNALTAYSWLERRFDATTRRWTAVLFLVLRTLSLGVVVFAPAALLSVMYEVPVEVTILGIGVLATSYTAMGGLAAVIATDVKQMLVMILGLGAAYFVVTSRLADTCDLGGSLRVLEATRRLELLDLRFDPSDSDNIWTALLGGTVLFLAYFGADQSQVQRQLAGRSAGHQRGGLLLTAIAKIPLQLGILLLGSLIFVDALAHGGPLVHQPTATRPFESAASVSARREVLQTIASGATPVERAEAERRLESLIAERTERVRAAIEDVAPNSDRQRFERADSNFVFARYALDHFPPGLIGLFVAAVLAAALSSIDSELNSLATVLIVDLLPGRTEGSEPETVLSRLRWATLAFGALASLAAFFMRSAGPLIEAVNRVGSLFYGTILGVFVLGSIGSRVGGRATRIGMLGGMAGAGLAAVLELPWLYRNTAGLLATISVALFAQRAAVGYHRREE